MRDSCSGETESAGRVAGWSSDGLCAAGSRLLINLTHVREFAIFYCLEITNGVANILTDHDPI